MIEINDKKSIGRVLFIVEGSKTEFAILRKIFCDILKYEYIEKRRNRPVTGGFFFALTGPKGAVFCKSTVFLS